MTVESEINKVNIPTVIVKYGGCQLVPAPLIDFTVESVFDDSGVRQANRTRIVLDGTILVIPSGSYEQMYVKQEQLRGDFSVDGCDFTITAGPGNKTLAEGTVICSGLKPDVVSLNIEPAVQVDRFDYTVELSDTTAASGVSGVTDSFSNQWSFREDGNSCTLEITHNVSARGINSNFVEAIRKVKANLGIDQLPIDLPCFTQPNASGEFGILHPSNLTSGDIYEVSVQREEVADVANGTYAVTEVFTLVSGVPYFFTARNESYNEDQNGVATVSVQGTVQGLGRTNTPGLGLDGGIGFQRACSGFIHHIRPLLPSDASGVYDKYKRNIGSGLNLEEPQSIAITQNKCQGTIQFSYSYTDDPAAFLPSGIASRTCNVTRNDGVRLFASHPIPFRRLGPIIQDIKTTTEGTITIQCNAVAKNTGDSVVDTNRAITFVEQELNRLKNINAVPSDFVTLRVQSLTQSNSDIDLSSSATIVYAFTVDLANVLDVNSNISLRTL
jgi:hypothetical protein